MDYFLFLKDFVLYQEAVVFDVEKCSWHHLLESSKWFVVSIDVISDYSLILFLND